MRHALSRLIISLMLCLTAYGTAAWAQEPKDEPIKQIKLTEAQVKSFVSAQPDLATVAPKLQQAGDTIQPGLQTESSTTSPRSMGLRPLPSWTTSPPISRSSWPG